MGNRNQESSNVSVVPTSELPVFTASCHKTEIVDPEATTTVHVGSNGRETPESPVGDKNRDSTGVDRRTGTLGSGTTVLEAALSDRFFQGLVHGPQVGGQTPIPLPGVEI